MISASGQTVWIHDVVAVETVDGTPSGLRGFFIDITERKQTERALQESEALFRALAEHSQATICLTDGQRLVYVNPRLEELTGYTRAELTSMQGMDLSPPDERESLNEQAQARLRGEDRPSRYETPKLTKKGETRWIDAAVTRVEMDGQPLNLIMGVDITDRRQTERALHESEATFRGFAEKSRAGILTTDGTRYIYVNPRYAEMTGYTEAELLRMAPADVVISDSRQMLADRMQARLRGEPEPAQYETQILTKQGETRWVDVSATRVVTGERPVNLCTIVDISERKAGEAAMDALRDQLAHVTRLSTLGELTSGLAHEINQPLAALLTNAQAGRRLLEQEPLDRAELAAALDDIAADARRAGAIIHRLGALVQKRPSERRPVDLHELVREVVQLVASDLRLKAIDVRYDLATDLPPVVGDRVQLQQVMLNLMVNAMEAIDRTGDERDGEVVIRTARADGGVAVAVEDNGVGIDAVGTARIFDPFVTTKAEGMGMGLSISTTIAQAHGGRLWATRNTERGATFHLSLPVAAPHADDA
jgi:PAS domain S-box-containing protein